MKLMVEPDNPLPLRVLITGCAGFIGSHTAERFLREGCSVVGVDNFDAYYPRVFKEFNLRGFRARKDFQFLEADLNHTDLEPLLADVDCVLHLAAQPGVRASWGDQFGRYVRNNIQATQRLLERCVAKPLRTFVYASSSSVYGAARQVPVSEDYPAAPISPYGVTKLCGEYLCETYRMESQVPIVRLRYFSVYGPRQRPDMLMHKIIRAGLRRETIEVYGDGTQSRDFTFVGDAVEANWLAARNGLSAGVVNVASGKPTTVNEVLRLFEDLSGIRPKVRQVPGQRGDPNRTLAATDAAKKLLGFEAKTSLREGLRRQIDWQSAHVLEMREGP